MAYKRSTHGDTTPARRMLKPLALAVSCACIAQSVQAEEIQEIVVTATRRNEAAQNIPYNISVLSSSALKNSGVTSISGLSQLVPGFTYIDMGARANGIASGIILRGLNATSAGVNDFAPPPGNPTVATYLDDTPLFANLKITDVKRVEVLRGPQGTLYGAGSVGGTVRFVYNKPDTEAFSADIESKLSKTSHAGNMNYSTDAVINLPISDHAALRVDAGYQYDAGVIDATKLVALDSNGIPVLADPSDPNSPPVYTRKNNVDDSKLHYIRAALLLEPTDTVDIQLTLHQQQNHADDYSGENPVTKNLTEQLGLQSPVTETTDLYSAEVNADLGFASLTSATAYTDVNSSGTSDATGYIETTVNSYYDGYPRPAYANVSATEDKRFTQELRLVSQGDGAWDWLAGAYYSRFHRTNDDDSSLLGWNQWLGGDFSTGDVAFRLNQTVRTEEKAAFGELTYHITDALQVTGGLRYFDLSDERSTVVGVPYVPLYSSGESDADDTGKLVKINVSYHFDPNLMVYFTRSEGYRQGGANAVPTIGPFAIPDPALIPYKPDRAVNWEIGAKGSQWGWLSYTAALYQIDWKNVQIQLPAPGSGIAILVNGNNAVSRGAELELKAHPIDHLDLGLGYSYDDAKLTEDFYITSGVLGYKGDKLPGVPSQQVTLSMDYNQPLVLFGANSLLHYHLDDSYRSHTTTALNSEVGNYAKLDGFSLWNASLTWTNGKWRTGAFINNIFDTAGITAVAYPFPDAVDGDLDFISRPRTVGMTLGYTFD